MNAQHENIFVYYLLDKHFSANGRLLRFKEFPRIFDELLLFVR